MILGMTPLTLVHVILSLIGIFSGLVIAAGMLGGKHLGGWTGLFLVTTIATSVTGFLFPFHKFLPSHGVGIISLVVLAIAIYALYVRRLAGGWRATYVITALLGLYFNVFVLVVQLFLKVPSLKALAPTQSESPFKIAQLVVLVLFVLIGVLAVRKFRNEPARAA